MISPTGQISFPQNQPATDSLPVGITSGPNNTIWFTEMRGLGQQDRDDQPRDRPAHRISDPDSRMPRPGYHAGPGRQPLVHRGAASQDRDDQPDDRPDHRVFDPIPARPSRTASRPGPDGNLWFTEQGSRQDRDDQPETHAITEFSVPDAPTPSRPGSPSGPDGNIWFTEFSSEKIGMVNPLHRQVSPRSPRRSPVIPIILSRGDDGRAGRSSLVHGIGEPQPWRSLPDRHDGPHR